jgi:rRNA maturation endonuclease Nob1
MQVNLKESEIAKAVELYLNGHGIKTLGRDVTIQFSMGKGVNGLKAEVEIEGIDQPEIPGFRTTDPVVLETKAEEPEVKPTKVAALIQHHTEEVQQKIAAATAEVQAEHVAAMAQVSPVAEHTEVLAVLSKADIEAEAALAEAEAAEAAQADKGPPFEADQPAAVAEPVAEAAPKAKRTPIFGKKAAAMVEPEPAAAPTTEPDLDEAGDDNGSFDLPTEGDAPAEAPEPVAEVKPTPIRRNTSSLFKKPAP